VREWTEVIERDYSHACVTVWVPFNESWGVPELTAVREQRHAVEALYHLTKTLDATRPVIGNDGWERWRRKSEHGDEWKLCPVSGPEGRAGQEQRA